MRAAALPRRADRNRRSRMRRTRCAASWYDGTPITWEDFYWQWRALNGSNKAYQISSSNGYSEIENVARGRDDRDVIVTFKNKYADWQSIFGAIYPASTNRSPQVFNE